MAITTAEQVGGGWDILADHDVPIVEQKALRKEIQKADGVYKGKQYKRLHILATTGECKRSKFKVKVAPKKKSKKDIEG